MSYLKEDAQLLTEEGELINNLQSIFIVYEIDVTSDDYDIDDYIDKMETVVKKKLDLYKNLYGRIQNFKKHLKEEEEIHSKVSKIDQIYYDFDSSHRLT